MQTDYVQRFVFEQLAIRGRLVCLTGAWQRMLEGRGYPANIAELLGHTTASYHTPETLSREKGTERF